MCKAMSTIGAEPPGECTIAGSLTCGRASFLRWKVTGFSGLPIVLLCIHVLGLIGNAVWHSPVFGERERLSAGYYHWRTLDFRKNPGNPPLNDLIAAAPVLLFARSHSQEVYLDKVLDPKELLTYVFLGRLALIPFSVLGGWICYSWSRELYGRRGGLLALVLWCFDPLILAHGALITGDLCATSLGITSARAFWLWMRKPTMGNSVISGVALGAALLAKYIWVILPPLFLLLWIARRFASPRPVRWPFPSQIIVMCLLMIYVINLGYAFQGTLQPWGTFQFQSPGLQQFAVDPKHPESGAGSWPREIPIPLPQQYIFGIDAIADHLRLAPIETYVHGEFFDTNVWYFYVYGLLVKMPLGTWLILLLAIWDWLTTKTLPAATRELSRPENFAAHQTEATELPGIRFTDGWWTALVFWLPALTVLVFVSSVTTIKLLRYLLPMLPFIFVWVGRTTVWAQQGGRVRNMVLWVLTGWTTLSSLYVYPHSLSYFNEAAGGPSNGDSHLIRASFDWGQDMLFLKDWVSSHQDATPLYVFCLNVSDPEQFEIHSQPIPQNGPEPGWYALSASILRGFQRQRLVSGSDVSNGSQYPALFLDETPVGHAGYSIRIYHLDCHQANAMRTRLGLDAIPCSEQSAAGNRRPGS